MEFSAMKAPDCLMRKRETMRGVQEGAAGQRRNSKNFRYTCNKGVSKMPYRYRGPIFT